MIKVSAMYPSGAGGRFDMTYYLTKHLPMALERLGTAVKGASVEQGLTGAEPGSPPPYLAMGHLLFESVEAFQQSFGPHAQALFADLPNYTDIEPTIQISEVKL